MESTSPHRSSPEPLHTCIPIAPSTARETVNFKGILRKDDDAEYSLPPEGQSLIINITDPRGNRVFSETLSINEFGAFHGNFLLAQGATLGEYSLEACIDRETHNQIFKVQDYTKADFEIKLVTDRQEYIWATR